MLRICLFPLLRSTFLRSMLHICSARWDALCSTFAPFGNVEHLRSTPQKNGTHTGFLPPREGACCVKSFWGVWGTAPSPLFQRETPGTRATFLGRLGRRRVLVLIGKGDKRSKQESPLTLPSPRETPLPPLRESPGRRESVSPPPISGHGFRG